MNGAELLTQLLMDAEVRTVFSVAGASHARLLDALDRAGMQIGSCRHESGAVTAADGYARITGGLGVALIIADQGLPNAIGGLAVAYTACSPVLVLVASPPGGGADSAARRQRPASPRVPPGRTVARPQRCGQFG